jgi:hypothetical protein
MREGLGHYSVPWKSGTQPFSFEPVVNLLVPSDARRRAVNYEGLNSSIPGPVTFIDSGGSENLLRITHLLASVDQRRSLR